MSNEEHIKPTWSTGDPVVSIIIVSFNTKEMTLECMRSIVRETPDLSYEVLFIDNQSTDGSWEAIASEFRNDPRFIRKLSVKNLGFAGANNEMAKEARGKYILLLNPDTLVLDKAIEKLVQFASEYPKNGIWGGKTVFADGSLNPTSCWGPYTLWSQFCRYSGLTWAAPKSSIFNPRGYGNWQRDTVREVGIVTGCFLLTKRDTWRSLGGFAQEFFMYGEESDLCMRATAQGFKPIVTPDAIIVHHGGASERILEDKMVRLLNAETRLCQRHWSPAGARVNLVMMSCGILLRAFAISLTQAINPTRENMWARLWSRRNEWTPDLFRSTHERQAR